MQRILLAVLLAATTVPCLAQPNRRRAPNPYQQIVRRYERVLGFSGSVLVARKGRVLYRGGAGMANAEWGQRNGPGTRHRVGSLTKAFTAAIILQLVQEGRLKTRDTLSSHLPWYRKDTGGRVTIQHLLRHTSGIPSYTREKEFRSRIRQHVQVKSFIQEHCSGDLEFEPGERFRYDNSGYFILGAIIEAVTGKRYEIALRERILDRLGMTQSGYDNHRAHVAQRAKGHERLGGVLVNADFIDLSIPFAAGSVYASVDDLLKWDRALYGDAVLGDASRRRMFTPGKGNYGYGWIISDVRFGDQQVPSIAHGGGIDGFAASLARFPETEGVVIVLSNVLERAGRRLSRDLARKLHGIDPDPPRADLALDLWRRLHLGDHRGARMLLGRMQEGRRKRIEASLAAVAGRLEDAGHLDEAAAIYRFDLELHHASAKSRSRLARIRRKDAALPQFVEQLEVLPGPAVWTEAVHPLDIDGDGRMDLLFANCNGWRRPGDMAAPSTEPLRPTLLLNERSDQGCPVFKDVSARFLPEGFRIHAKNAAVCDVNGDGHADIAFAVAFGARPRLLVWDAGSSRFRDETEQRLPAVKLNSNGVGWGDLDDDGDIDLVFVDSGPASDRPPGGRARLFLNDGSGRFQDAPERLDAALKVGAQNAKIVDIDGDLDLDVIVDGKSRVTQLYLNDGNARFTQDLVTIPKAAPGGQPYEIEWGDLDGDGDLDAVHMSWGGGRRERYRNVLLENQLAQTRKLGFKVVMDGFVGRNDEDENEFAFLDADDDGDLDLVVATLLSGPVEEKLFLNGGTMGRGFLRQKRGAFSHFADGTLDLAVADFDGDGAYDIVTAQGENTRYEGFENRYYRNTGPKDTRAPRVQATTQRMSGGELIVRADLRDAVVDDGRSLLAARVVWSGGKESAAMVHVGGGIFRASIPLSRFPEGSSYRILVRDPAGNEATSAPVTPGR